MPFQIYGTPHVKHGDFQFKPQALEGFDKNPMYKGQACYGYDLRNVQAPKGLSLKYVIESYHAYKQAGKADLFFSRPSWFDLLMGTSSVRQQIIEGKDENDIRVTWKEKLDAYHTLRNKYLLY